MSRRSIHRRSFIQGAAVAGIAGPTILRSLARGAVAPSDRITIGMIGVGTMGRSHVSHMVNVADAQIVAVCDVVKERREYNKNTIETAYAKQADRASYQGCAMYNDFRELIARDDIQAVLIATPDHWHTIAAITATRAKKDVYCEKPLTLTINEGQKLVAAVREHSTIFQTGSQQRSEFGGKFRTACELIRSGRIGKLKTIRIGVGGPPVVCDLPTQDVPEGTDWNMWVGQAAMRGYNEILCPKGVHMHFPAWRNYTEFGNGGLGDMGAHHFDIAQWAMDMDHSGPVKIEPPPGDATTGLKFTYKNGVEMIHGGKVACTFEGTEGTIIVDRDKLLSTPAEIVKTPLGPNDVHLYMATNHHRNWLDCIKSRKLPIADVEIGHRSATVVHLANLGYQLRRPLTWDPDKEEFPGDAEANALRERKMREPWKI